MSDVTSSAIEREGRGEEVSMGEKTKERVGTYIGKQCACGELASFRLGSFKR